VNDSKAEPRLSNESCPKCLSLSEVLYAKDKGAREIYCAYCGEFEALEIDK